MYIDVLFDLADSPDVDLDAILGELCALEQRCENDIACAPNSDNQRQIRPTNGRIHPGDSTDIGKNEGTLKPSKIDPYMM